MERRKNRWLLPAIGGLLAGLIAVVILQKTNSSMSSTHGNWEVVFAKSVRYYVVEGKGKTFSVALKCENPMTKPSDQSQKIANHYASLYSSPVILPIDSNEAETLLRNYCGELNIVESGELNPIYGVKADTKATGSKKVNSVDRLVEVVPGTYSAPGMRFIRMGDAGNRIMLIPQGAVINMEEDKLYNVWSSGTGTYILEPKGGTVSIGGGQNRTLIVSVEFGSL